MEKKKINWRIVLCCGTFILLWLIYNGLWNVALYSNSEVISFFVFKGYCLFLSPASGIALALGAISTLEIKGLIPEEKRQSDYHMALMIMTTILGNSFTSYLISKRPNCSVELDVWLLICGITLINCLWYFLLVWAIGKKKAIKTEEPISATKEVNEIETNIGSRDLVLEVLKKIGCKPVEENEIKIRFSYQGETFAIDATNDYYFINIYDLWWYEIPLDDNIDEFARMQKAINYTNTIGTCTVLYSINEQEGVIGVSSKNTLLFTSQIPKLDIYMLSILDGFFKTKQNVMMEMEKYKVREEQL